MSRPKDQLPMLEARTGGSAFVRSGLALVLLLSLGACSSQLKKAESELYELSDLLPGSYNNVAQAQAEAQSGQVIHPALALDIVRLDMPMLSDYVFYAQESVADDPLRVTSQRLFTFEPAKDGSIIETLYTFKQPNRWRDGHLNAGLFKSIMLEDTKAMGGCELLWKKEGDKFVASNRRENCRVTSGSLGSVHLDIRRELSADELAMAELAFGAGGKLVQGSEAEPFYRFSRGGAP